MAIIELDAGEKHTFSLSALRVQVTGGSAGLQLQALDQSGTDVADVRLRPVEIVLTPRPRRLRLVVTPTEGPSFPGGTSLGLTLSTEGASTSREQVLVSAHDVGALAQHELAVLEFAGDRSIVTVSRPAQVAPTQAPPATTGFVSGERYRPDAAGDALSASATSAPARPSGPPPSDADHAWLRDGRYALRDAPHVGEVAAPSSASWSVVVDGSISMLGLHHSGALGDILELVCGAAVSWIGSWPASTELVGAARLPMTDVTASPRAFGGMLEEAPPWSGSTLGAATEEALQRVGPGGLVVVVTDGVPGDVEVMTDGATRRGDRRLVVVATGTSAHSLEEDTRGRSWWQEDLSGFDRLAALANTEVVAVALDDEQRARLSGSRAAELAWRMTSVAAR